MIVAPCALNEQERLEALQRYGVLDTDTEADFDNITALVAAICETPIALVSLVDRDRQWFKSKVGLDAHESSRDVAFCTHAILQDHVLMVPDATQDVRFATNPLVVGDPKIRFYAGAPLLTPDNYAIGTLCAIDMMPRTLTPLQLQALQTLAAHVVNLLELRLQLEQTRKLNTALEEANRQRSRLFASINHDMRAPLTAIMGFSRRLQKRIAPDMPSYLQDGLDMILGAAEQLGALVDDVLDFSKVDAGKMQLDIHAFKVRPLVQDVVNTLSVRAEERNVLLMFEISERVPVAFEGDARKLSHMLMNLLVNAVKFTPNGKRVFLRCDFQDDALELVVADEGVGIPKQDLERIFLPFEQSSLAPQTETKGTGLGLAIVKAYAELMGGEVSVSSTLGEGTTFRLQLPMSAA